MTGPRRDARCAAVGRVDRAKRFWSLAQSTCRRHVSALPPGMLRAAFTPGVTTVIIAVIFRPHLMMDAEGGHKFSP